MDNGRARTSGASPGSILTVAATGSAKGGTSMATDTALGVATGHAPRRDEGFELTGPGTAPRQLLREIWTSRRLIGVLARKDFLVKYRRTSLGLIWAVALPAIQALVLAVVFSHLIGSTHGLGGVSGGRTTAYGVFIFAAIVPWSFFNAAFAAGATSVVDGTGLARRIYFPRVVLPLISVVTAMFPLIITVGILLVMEIVLGPEPGLRTLWMLPGMVLVTVLAASLSVFVSAAHVYVRDLRYAVSAGMLMLFYITPVIYPADRLPDNVREVVRVLPTAGPVELFRLSIGAADTQWWIYVLSSGVWALVVGVAGFVLHCRRDRVLTDRL
jgi:lipopolysaccharide transport system permease protein